MCWKCKVGEYIVYYSDLTNTPRCGRCGELEQDDPAKKKAAPKRAASKRTKE